MKTFLMIFVFMSVFTTVNASVQPYNDLSTPFEFLSSITADNVITDSGTAEVESETTACLIMTAHCSCGSWNFQWCEGTHPPMHQMAQGICCYYCHEMCEGPGGGGGEG